MKHNRVVQLTIVAACALLLVACGSSGKSGSRASVASQGLQFANCMRAHGISNFPDPGPGGALKLTPGSGLNPSSPAFEAAQRACKRYAPTIAGPPAMSESERRNAVAFAECMRAHGEPGFPDPLLGSPKGNGPVLALRGMYFSIGSGINPMSTAFKRAAQACGMQLP
jgi:hypothetical protein